MIVNPKNDFCTQREYPFLAKIVATIHAEEGVLSLYGPFTGTSVKVREWEHPDRVRLTVRVWDSIVDNAMEQAEHVSDWLSKEMAAADPGVPGKFRLVFMGEQCARLRKDGSMPVSFADGYPVLVRSLVVFRGVMSLRACWLLCAVTLGASLASCLVFTLVDLNFPLVS
jgi:uncharacterized protein YcbX